MSQLTIPTAPLGGGIGRPTATALSIPMIFSEIASRIGAWFGPYVGLSMMANIICMIGLWQSKRWGVYAYASLVLVNQVVLFSKGQWNLFVLITQGNHPSYRFLQFDSRDTTWIPSGRIVSKTKIVGNHCCLYGRYPQPIQRAGR